MNKKYKAFFLIPVLVFVVNTVEASIVNPSFELFSGTVGADGGAALAPGSNTLTGWTIVGGQSALLTSPNNWALTASDGNNFLDLTGYASAGGAGFPKGVSQTLTGLIVGQSYMVSMDLGVSNDNPACTNCGGPVSVSASVGNTSEILTHNSIVSGNIWDTYSFTFLADNSEMDLTILGNSAPGIYLGLDNVSLAAVPLPAAFWLLLSGFGFLFFVRHPVRPIKNLVAKQE